MSYEDVVGCDAGVGFAVCISLATAIPSRVFAKGVLCFFWCACGTSPSMDGCGGWYVCYLYGVKVASVVCLVGEIVIVQCFIISVFCISVRWGVASRG